MHKALIISILVTAGIVGAVFALPASADDTSPDGSMWGYGYGYGYGGGYTRPGWGWGDENHDHSGPPGAQNGEDDDSRPGWGWGDEKHDHSGPPGQAGPADPVNITSPSDSVEDDADDDLSTSGVIDDDDSSSGNGGNGHNNGLHRGQEKGKGNKGGRGR